MAQSSAKAHDEERGRKSAPQPVPTALEEQRTPAPMMRVQRSAGNRATATMIRRSPGLTVGPADDRWEREADSVADRVVAALRGGQAHDDEPAAQRSTTADRGALQMQRRAAGQAGQVGHEGGPVDADFEHDLTAARSGGTQLPMPVRRSMERAFGADFSGVRVHDGAQSTELNDAVSAKAFTVGSDIFFRDGVPDATSSTGQQLLAHELTHTLQQGAGAARQVSRSSGVLRRAKKAAAKKAAPAKKAAAKKQAPKG